MTNQPKPVRSFSGGTTPVRRLPTRLPSTAAAVTASATGQSICTLAR